jgi:hypothetical protein
VLAGVLYAADIDADVANMSLGGSFHKMGNGRFVGLINKTFSYAHQQGTVVVVAAGNESHDIDHDGPLFKTYCNAPNVVCVSALGPTKATTTLIFENLDSFASYFELRTLRDQRRRAGRHRQRRRGESAAARLCDRGLLALRHLRGSLDLRDGHVRHRSERHVDGRAARERSRRADRRGHRQGQALAGESAPSAERRRSRPAGNRPDLRQGDG